MCQERELRIQRLCDAWAVVASSYWARVLVPLTLFIVPLTDLLWMGHLPK